MRGRLVNGERVHVGANADHRPVGGSQFGDHTRLGHAGSNAWKPEFVERLGDNAGRPSFLEPEFRVSVQVAPHADDVVFDLVGLFEHRFAS